MSWGNQTDPGLFFGTTQVWNTQGLSDRELLVQLYQNLNNMALALNLKDSGYYVGQEFVNGQIFSPASGSSSVDDYRQVFRKVIECGALPNAATKAVAHNITITSGFNFTRIYGTATNPSTSFIPLPYSSSTLNENIKLEVDATNVNITTAINYSAYTTTWVVLEYLKS